MFSVVAIIIIIKAGLRGSYREQLPPRINSVPGSWAAAPPRHVFMFIGNHIETKGRTWLTQTDLSIMITRDFPP